jgi:hypothetical protein
MESLFCSIAADPDQAPHALIDLINKGKILVPLRMSYLIDAYAFNTFYVSVN